MNYHLKGEFMLANSPSKSIIFTNKDVKRQSILVAFIASIPALNSVITALIPSLAGSLMAILYLIGAGAFFINLMLSRQRYEMNFTLVFVLCVFVFAYFLTSLTDIKMSVSPMYFGVYFVLAILVSSSQINAKIFVESCVLIPVIGNFWAGEIFSQTLGYISMGMSYAFLLPVISSLVYLIKVKGKNILATLSAILNFGYLYQLVFFGSRGPILCIAICLVLLATVKKKQGIGVQLSSLKIVILSGILIFFVVNFENIIGFLISFLDSINIKVGALNKIQRLLLEDNLTNGRDEVLNATLSGILQKPLFGHGIASFNHFTSLVYPHNFILQMAYDVGIPFTIVVLGLVIIGMVNWFKSCDHNSFILLIILFSASIPGALFSNDLWSNFLLWITLGLFIKRLKVTKFILK